MLLCSELEALYDIDIDWIKVKTTWCHITNVTMRHVARQSPLDTHAATAGM